MYKIIGGDQQEYGPASTDEVRQWISEGRLNSQSQARGENDPAWRPLGTFPEFAAELSLQAERLLISAVPPRTAPSGSDEPFPGAESAAAGTIHIGACLRRSWRLFAANPGLLFASVFLIWMISVIAQLLPVGAVLYWVFKGALYGGLYLVFLRLIRGQSPGVGDVFSGFGPGASQLMLAGMVTSALTWIGFFFCFLPWVYLTVAWMFAVPLAADRGMEFWPAMRQSLRTVNRVWFQAFLLALLAFLPVVLMHLITEIRVSGALFSDMQAAFGPGGLPNLPKLMEMMPELMQKAAHTGLPYMLVTKVVLLLNLPFAIGALMYAYEDLFGSRPGTA